MTTLNQIRPWTHGIEIEQFPADTNVGAESYAYGSDVVEGGLPTEVVRDADELSWHRDGSGPQETDIGPFKTAKSCLNTFFAETRDKGLSWDWHAAGNGNGCGSHVHLSLDSEKIQNAGMDVDAAWTIAYNTTIELAPFLSPFWCHDWEAGFRNGEGSITRWADPQTVRASQDSVRSMVERGASAPGAGAYPSVRANAPRRNKPFTIEIRMNEGHPTMALAGLTLLRLVIGRAIDRGDSPKLADTNALAEVYSNLYGVTSSSEGGLMDAMKAETNHELTFMEGRGIPLVDELAFESPWDLFEQVQKAYHRAPRAGWIHHAQALALTGDDRCSPANNADALWQIDQDDFSWEVGPEEAKKAAQRDEIEARLGGFAEEIAAAAVVCERELDQEADEQGNLNQLFG